MVSHALLLILGGCILGAVQLVVGIAIGMWLRKEDKVDVPCETDDMIQASAIAKRLQALADEMTFSVGEHRSELDHASRMLADNDRPDQALAELVVEVIDDIVRANQNLQSKLETAERRLQEQASEIETYISRSLTDALTGLPNRREFNDRLEERMAAWNRRGEIFSLMFIDVDHFKKLNDQHGHLAGDQVLAAMGRAMRAAIRREDAVARYGGEEFAILMPHTTLEQAVVVAEKVRREVARLAILHNDQQLSVTASCGIAMIDPQDDAPGLIQRADAALYAAKAAGRNCAFLHDGRECRPTTDTLCDPKKPASAAAEIIELIHAPEPTAECNSEAGDNDSAGFGSYLPREEISPELAQTCEELRRFIEERGQPELAAAEATPSANR